MAITSSKTFSQKQFAAEVAMRDTDYIKRRDKLLAEKVPNINCKSCSTTKQESCKVMGVPKNCLPAFNPSFK